MKNQSILSIILLSIIVVIFSSCEIEVPVPSELSTNSKLVLYSKLEASTDTLFFMMNRSVPIFNGEKVSESIINIDKVTLSSNKTQFTFNKNEVFEQVLYNKNYNDSYYYIVLPSVIEEGITYTLAITTDKNETISGSTTIPTYVPSTARLIIDSTLESDSYNNSSYYRYFYQLEFQDKINEKNYYAVGFNADYFNEFEYNQQITNDLNFDGKKIFSEYSNLSFGSGYPISNYLFIIKAIDENYYKHYQKLNNYSGSNPFSEPQNLYSNVTGGLGCVYSSNLKPVTIIR